MYYRRPTPDEQETYQRMLADGRWGNVSGLVFLVRITPAFEKDNFEEMRHVYHVLPEGVEAVLAYNSSEVQS